MGMRVGRRLRAAVLVVGGWMMICVGMAGAQVGAGRDAEVVGPAFEVAVVRPSTSDGSNGNGMAVEPSGRFKVHALSAEFMFWQACREGSVEQNVVVDRGAPKWVESQTYDVNAKVDTAAIRGWETMSSQQRFDAVRPMIRRLLADRFHS